MNTKKSVGIIGAGIGGLTAGALLTKEGYKVTIFEKESLIGGRALSIHPSDFTLEEYENLLSRFHMNVPFSEPDIKTIFEKDMLKGYKLDLGYHAIAGGAISNIKDIFSELDKTVTMFETHIGFIGENSHNFPFLSRGDKIKILPNILRLLFSGERTMKQLDAVSMTETINKYGKGKMKLILEVFSRAITTVNNLDRISTGESFRSQKNLLRGSKPIGYPKNGLSDIYEVLADYITKNGGEINLKKPVQSIIIDKNKATGLIVEDEKLFFENIISNILVQNLFKLADEKYFPSDYVKNIKSLTGTGSLCAYYSVKELDQNLIGKTFFFIERDAGLDGKDAVGMIDFMTATQSSGIAPPSHYLVQSYIICTPKEAKNKEILEDLKKILDKNLETLIPDLHSQLRWALYPAVWHLDGVAKTIDNIKPDIKTPINNLYIAGDCVKASGIGIDCALNSAQIVKDLLTR